MDVKVIPTQMTHISIPATSADSESLRLVACIAHLICWMMMDKLKLNER